MADSPVNRMSFSWHDIFTLMKQTRNLSEKAEVITTALLQIVGGDKLIIPFC
ncbi:putative transposase for transposon Tn3 [Escherichia coli 2-460-02_S1_C3]|nr:MULTISPECIES: hypothetical protein [Enterobacteriaceae]ENB27724.1 putative transposase for transposon Tn3 [Escherichia coli BCE008_MS-01]KDV76463.1 putative transposase for transposon Tn3 [Escherichia coli 2-052-05_S4_C2]KEJ43344.1 putative transposase for transposon Tn3 [Escherichia coli 2-460-02_S1_C3]